MKIFSIGKMSISKVVKKANKNMNKTDKLINRIEMNYVNIDKRF